MNSDRFRNTLSVLIAVILTVLILVIIISLWSSWGKVADNHLYRWKQVQHSPNPQTVYSNEGIKHCVAWSVIWLSMWTLLISIINRWRKGDKLLIYNKKIICWIGSIVLAGWLVTLLWGVKGVNGRYVEYITNTVREVSPQNISNFTLFESDPYDIDPVPITPGSPWAYVSKGYSPFPFLVLMEYSFYATPSCHGSGRVCELWLLGSHVTLSWPLLIE